MINEASGTGGRGFVLQDINAPMDICMKKIRDLSSYSKYVT